MEINEVKIGDTVAFTHNKKKVMGKVIYRHDDSDNKKAERASLMGHVNVEIHGGDESYPVTMHVSKLKPVVQEEIQMEEHLDEAVLDLIDHIDSGDNLAAEAALKHILQSRVDELMDELKVDVASSMFNTEACADCDEELEEGMVKAANKQKKGEYIGRSVGDSRRQFVTRNDMQAARQRLKTSPTSNVKEDVEAMEEGLKGNQHKIDANKNGKIDAMDFKMLRKKKNMGEAYADPYAAKKAAEMKKKQDELMTSAKKEYEASKESQGKLGKNFLKMKKEEVEQMDELSNKTLSSYVDKASASRREADKKSTERDYLADIGIESYASGAARRRSGRATSMKRSAGIKTAADKMKKEEVEQMDELSNKTLSSYVDKASASRREADKKSTETYMSRSGRATSMKRSAGISNAYRAMKKEEVEQVDELSNKTMKSYMKKATTSRNRNYAKGDLHAGDAERHLKAASASYKVADKREKGMQSAKKKMNELKDDTYGSYIQKAAWKVGDNAAMGASVKAPESKYFRKKELKRHEGIRKAVNLLTRKRQVKAP